MKLILKKGITDELLNAANSSNIASQKYVGKQTNITCHESAAFKACFLLPAHLRTQLQGFSHNTGEISPRDAGWS